MARRRKRRTSLWTAVPVWTLVAALVGWGLWQANQFRRALLAEGDAPHLVETQPAAVPDEAPETLVDIEPLRDPSPEFADPLISTIPDSPPPPELTDAQRAAEAAKLLAAAKEQLDSSNILEARNLMNRALTLSPDGAVADDLRTQLADLNFSTILGSAILPDDPIAHYVNIEAGDSYQKLGAKYAVPAALLAQVNPTINARNLKTGTGLKIVEGPFNLRFSRRDNRLDLYTRDLYVKSFNASIEEGDFLPRGTYRVKPASKIQVGSKLWIGLQAADKTTPIVDNAWIYGSAGPRNANANSETTGLKLRDPDLAELYNLLVEAKSYIRVDP